MGQGPTYAGFSSHRHCGADCEGLDDAFTLTNKSPLDDRRALNDAGTLDRTWAGAAAASGADAEPEPDRHTPQAATQPV